MTSPRRVFFMQCGFGMLEAGSVTARATTNILLKNLLDASISAVAWYSLGYGLAFERGCEPEPGYFAQMIDLLVCDSAVMRK